MDAADLTTEKERHMMEIKMANCASENDMQPIEKKKYDDFAFFFHAFNPLASSFRDKQTPRERAIEARRRWLSEFGFSIVSIFDLIESRHPFISRFP
ncbi:hypothetical protein K1719_006811 [Acacia pycnantha]|nr:hypothetical protein K1719_006811 [Acacia pycnantha]